MQMFVALLNELKVVEYISCLLTYTHIHVYVCAQTHTHTFKRYSNDVLSICLIEKVAFQICSVILSDCKCSLWLRSAAEFAY